MMDKKEIDFIIFYFDGAIKWKYKKLFTYFKTRYRENYYFRIV